MFAQQTQDTYRSARGHQQAWRPARKWHISEPCQAAPEDRQEVSKMMMCRWVHADDGALVMEWTTAEGAAVYQGAGDDAAYAFEMFDHSADVLTPAGV
jgi:hypothetical protein